MGKILGLLANALMLSFIACSRQPYQPPVSVGLTEGSIPFIGTSQTLSSATGTPIWTTSSVPAAIDVDDDPYQGYLEYRSNPVAVSDDLRDYAIYALYARKSRETGAIDYFAQVLLLYFGHDWRLYYRANDRNAQSLSLSQVMHDVDCHRSSCYYHEAVNVYFTDAHMKDESAGGISFKLFSKRSKDREIEIPSRLVQEMYRVVNKAAGTE